MDHVNFKFDPLNQLQFEIKVNIMQLNVEGNYLCIIFARYNLHIRMASFIHPREDSTYILLDICKSHFCFMNRLECCKRGYGRNSLNNK